MLAPSTTIQNTTTTTGATTEQPVPLFAVSAPSKIPAPAAAEAAAAAAGGGGSRQISPSAQAAAAAVAADPRLAKCGFAKLLGDNGLEFYVRKYEVILGRKSKASQVDVELGESAVVSRQHAKIYYNFELKRWELAVEGKNGVSVNGTLYTPQSGPCPLQSQDFLQAGDYNIYFLLPKQPRKPRAPKSKGATPTPPDVPQPQQHPQLQQQQQQHEQPQQHTPSLPPLPALHNQNQQLQQQPILGAGGLRPYGSGPLLPGVAVQSSSPQLGSDFFDVPGSSEGPQRYLQSNSLPDGGSELGFNIDGMMAGYGAPNTGSAEVGMLTPGVNGNSMGLMYDEREGDEAMMLE